MTNDPIADFLTRIRNALLVGHDQITLPSSKTKVEIARVLKEQGYIAEFATAPAPDVPGDDLTVRLRYDDDRRPVLSGLKRISKPGRRVFVAKNDIPRVLGGMGTTIMSTSGGIMTGHEAKKKGLGG
ncbi:MAG: 30S ribosomal protein S8, partial [Thermoleophilaceae bacterium]|nr:30S ribosomal protein S8 [Thermoleophilaceae bacterium]